MPRLRFDVPDAELAVLKALWDRGDSTIRDLADELYPGGETSHYATVQKLLERLEARAAVERRREGRVNVFRAVAQRDDLIRQRLRDAADKLCEGSLTPLLTQLVSSRSLPPEELQKLRALIDEMGGTS